MSYPFGPGDRTPEGLLTPEAYRRWFAWRTKGTKPPTRCALILAGGRSRRMGRDKAELSFQGETLLSRAVRFWQASGRVDGVLVSLGAADADHPLPDGAIAVVDDQPDQGPMAGLVAAFTQTAAELVYVSAVDMPFLDANWILPEPAGNAIAYQNPDGTPEPLFAVYRRSVLPVAQRLLESGDGRMAHLLEQVGADFVPVPSGHLPLFANLNTPRAMQRARAGTPPMVAVIGWSGVGKTTYLEGLLPALQRRGIRVAVCKHDAHGFQMDTPGTDTHRFSQAGAEAVAISGPNGWAMLGRETIGPEQLRAMLPPVDLILLEGYKYSPLPKLELHRSGHPGARITQDDTLLAFITDEPLEVAKNIPQLGLDDFDGCAQLLWEVFLAPEGGR